MDVERTIQFILEQQAQISAQFSNFQTQFAAFQTQVAASEARFANDIVQINSVLLDLATSQERTNAILEILAERQIHTERTLNSLMATVDSLTATVERHIANHK